MNTRLSPLDLLPAELADPQVATLYLACLDAEKQLRGASKMAAAAVYEVRERQLTALWARLDALDAGLSNALQEAVRDWHEVAVKLRGGA